MTRSPIRRIAMYNADAGGSGGGAPSPAPQQQQTPPEQQQPSSGQDVGPAPTTGEYRRAPRIGYPVLVKCPELTQPRPALVTQVWSPTCINAAIFCDGANDAVFFKLNGLVGHKTSLVHDPGLKNGYGWDFID